MSGCNELVVTIKEEEVGVALPAKFYSKETLEIQERRSEQFKNGGDNSKSGKVTV